jgi:hypothetical protein
MYNGISSGMNRLKQMAQPSNSNYSSASPGYTPYAGGPRAQSQQAQMSQQMPGGFNSPWDVGAMLTNAGAAGMLQQAASQTEGGSAGQRQLGNFYSDLLQRLEQQAMPQMQAAPYGMNYLAGMAGHEKESPYNLAPQQERNPYTSRNDEWQLSQMNPEAWGAIQRRQSQGTANIYDTWDQRQNQWQNYMNSTSPQNNPVTINSQGQQIWGPSNVTPYNSEAQATLSQYPMFAQGIKNPMKPQEQKPAQTQENDPLAGIGT